MTIKTELLPIHDSRKSFYNKAIVEHDYNKGFITLYSYNTPVCYIDNHNKFHRLWWGYSATTMRHVNEFVTQYGIPGGGKQWWDSLKVTA